MNFNEELQENTCVEIGVEQLKVSNARSSRDGEGIARPQSNASCDDKTVLPILTPVETLPHLSVPFVGMY